MSSKSLKFIVSAAAVSAVIAGSALADGRAYRGSIKDAPYIAPFSWTGFYVGANVGYAWTDQSFSHEPFGAWTAGDAAVLRANGSGSFSDNSFTGGVQAGYNVQLGTIVLGVEADINALDTSRSVSRAAPTGVAATGVYTTSGGGDWYGTLRARLGLAFGNSLLYATGGLAYAEHTVSQSVFFNATGSRASGSSSDTSTGWALGAGLEHALNRNWTIRAEYLHVDLGSVTTTLFNPAFPTFGHSVKSDLEFDVVRLGINYKF